jgi:hypothetical protein
LARFTIYSQKPPKRLPVGAHLSDVPESGLGGDLGLPRVAVQGDVEVSFEELHLDLVPVLVVQQAAKGHLLLAD